MPVGRISSAQITWQVDLDHQRPSHWVNCSRKFSKKANWPKKVVKNLVFIAKVANRLPPTTADAADAAHLPLSQVL